MNWFNTPAPYEGEACLSVDIYVPTNIDKNSKKAVMVWFYGVNLMYGNYGVAIYNASGLAAHEDVIVAVPN
jgi:carboxylesterase type B